MELLLSIEAGIGSADVRVKVDPAQRVSALGSALGSYFGTPSTVSIWRNGETEPLAADATLSDVGLVSGERLGLGRPLNDTGSDLLGDLYFAVISGHGAGRTIPVGRVHRRVGRSTNCDLHVEDPLISRQQFTIVVTPESKVQVSTNPTSPNEVRLNGTPVQEVFFLGPGDTVMAGQTSFALRERRKGPLREFHSFGSIPFSRTPYFRRPTVSTALNPIDVPSKPSNRRFNFISLLAPLFFGFAMAIVLNNPRFLFFACMSPVIAVANYVDQRWVSGKEHRVALERFEESLEGRDVEIEDALERERVSRNINAPDIGSLCERAQSRLKDLWVRGRGVDDFLHLRVGVGEVTPQIEVPAVSDGDSVLIDRLADAESVADLLPDMPVVVDVASLGTLALVGEDASVKALAGALLLQGACLHSPEDLVVMGVIDADKGMHSWLKWLPHVHSSSSPLGGDHLATTSGAGAELLHTLAEIAEQRIAGREANLDRRWPWLLVALDAAVVDDGSVTARLLDAGAAAGVTVVWMCESEYDVPRQAGAVIACADDDSFGSRIEFVDPDREGATFDIERVSADVALNATMALAGLRDASATNAVTAIPQMVTLYEALGTQTVSSVWIQRLWSQNKQYELRAPVGYSEFGVFEIDLVAHGPHGLIGGTSGAGKSELLQSLLTGLVTYNSPSRVNLLFVDYKGGALSKKFDAIPHTVGSVTNLDSLLAQRALTSLIAELNYRMELFGSSDMRKMIEEGDPETPASLVIVIDEFAALVRELPEFIEGIVSIAERGRSLGIHLLLSTQRPSGSINDSIQQNTNLRIALRMLDSSESNNVIGTSDAALIPNPLKGRALARLGAGQLIPFQAAWSEAPAVSIDESVVEVTDFTVGPRLSVAGSPGTLGSADFSERSVQLETVLSAIGDIGAPRGRAPWLDPLPATVSLRSVLEADHSGLIAQSPHAPGVLRVGMVDDPERQAQYPSEIDFSAGAYAIFGAAHSGKTTVLTTIAASAAITGSEAPCDDESMIFGLDFASGTLGVIKALPQTVLVASGDELEEVTRVISVLDQEFTKRRSQLRSGETETFAPIFLLVDGWNNLSATLSPAHGGGSLELQRWLELLTRLISRGREVGIYTALSSTEPLRTRLMSSIADRLVLHQLGEGDYRDLGIPLALARGVELRPGQGFNGSNQVVQVATVADSGELEDTDAFEKLGAEIPARAVPLRTEALPESVVFNRKTHLDTGLAIGIADLSLKTVGFDPLRYHLAISGPPRSGRTTVLLSLARQLEEQGMPFLVAGPRQSPLSTIAWKRGVFGNVDDVAAFLELLESAEKTDGFHVLIDDANDLDDRSIHGVFGRLLAQNTRFIAVGESFRRVGVSNPLLTILRDTRASLHLQPEAREIAEISQTRFSVRPGVEMPRGRGVLLLDRMPIVVQTFSVELDSADAFPET